MFNTVSPTRSHTLAVQSPRQLPGQVARLRLEGVADGEDSLFHGIDGDSSTLL